jgi:hypothetical protein
MLCTRFIGITLRLMKMIPCWMSISVGEMAYGEHEKRRPAQPGVAPGDHDGQRGQQQQGRQQAEQPPPPPVGDHPPGQPLTLLDLVADQRQ